MFLLVFLCKFLGSQYSSFKLESLNPGPQAGLAGTGEACSRTPEGSTNRTKAGHVAFMRLNTIGAPSYLEQDICFLERRFSCEEREVKELRETFDEWHARMNLFHMVRLCDSFTQTSSSNVLIRQHPT